MRRPFPGAIEARSLPRHGDQPETNGAAQEKFGVTGSKSWRTSVGLEYPYTLRRPSWHVAAGAELPRYAGMRSWVSRYSLARRTVVSGRPPPPLIQRVQIATTEGL